MKLALPSIGLKKSTSKDRRVCLMPAKGDQKDKKYRSKLRINYKKDHAWLLRKNIGNKL